MIFHDLELKLEALDTNWKTFVNFKNFFHFLVLTEIPRLEMPPPPPPMPPPITEILPQKIEDAPDAPSKIPVDDDRAGLMAAIR